MEEASSEHGEANNGKCNETPTKKTSCEFGEANNRQKIAKQPTKNTEEPSKGSRILMTHGP